MWHTLATVTVGLTIIPCSGCTGETFWAIRGTIDAVTFVPESGLLAVGGRDAGTESFSDHGDIKLYDSGTGTVVRSISLDHRVHLIACSPLGNLLAVVTRSRQPQTYELLVYELTNDGNAVVVFGPSPVGLVWELSFSPDGHLLAWCSREELMIMNTAAWQKVLLIPGSMRTFAWSSDSQSVALVPWDKNMAVQQWDVTTNEKAREFAPADLILRSPIANAWLACRRDPTRLVVWKADDDIEQTSLPIPDGRTCLALSASNSRVAAILDARQHLFHGGTSADIAIWDVRGLRGHHVLRVPLRWAHTVAFLRDGDFLAVGAQDGVAIIDLQTCELVKRLPMPKGLHLAVGGPKLATWTGEKIAVWDLTAGCPRRAWEARWRKRPPELFE